MENRRSFELSPDQHAHLSIFRSSYDANVIMERLRNAIPDIDFGVQFLDNPSTRGFLIDMNVIPQKRQDVIAIMEILKENCRDNGYVTYMSDAYELDGNHFVRHYLKPSYKFLQTSPINQLFGNVQIEFESYPDQRPKQLKVTATNYPGPNYESNTSLHEFLEMITTL